jgi:hypothetical protein
MISPNSRLDSCCATSAYGGSKEDKVRLAIWTVAVCVSLPVPAMSADANLRDLAAHPQQYIAHEVDLGTVFCGNNGDQSAYMCSTSGNVFVDLAGLAQNKAKEKIDAECGGIDWTEKSPSCRFRLRFTPASFRVDAEIEQGKRSIVFTAPSATAQ